MLKIFKAPPAAPLIEDSDESRRLYRHWRIRTMYSMMIGYAIFYFCRKNFSMAMPTFLSDMGYTKTDLGLILTVFSIVYGVGKFVNGVLSDRSNARYFMAFGLLMSAVVNVLFGLSTALWAFGFFWLLNAWFQSMGWPPCARLLTHWYSPTELGTKWGIWNASHQVGGAGILILAGWLIPNFGWRSAFFVPAAIGAITALYLVNRLRDTPSSLGLPEIEKFRNETSSKDLPAETALSVREILFHHVLNNRLVWMVSLANMFVYIVRIGVLDWAPTFLVEAKGSSLIGAGVKVAGFEIAGIVGALAAGWMSDVWFKGRRGPVNVIFMVLVTAALIEFWLVPPGHPILDGTVLIVVGFLIYGPQMLVGVSAADFATKKAAATATGMTGTFGYIGSALCGVGTGLIVDKWGWDGGFLFFIGSAVIGTLLFLFTWNRRSTTLDEIHSENGKSSSN